MSPGLGEVLGSKPSEISWQPASQPVPGSQPHRIARAIDNFAMAFSHHGKCWEIGQSTLHRALVLHFDWLWRAEAFYQFAIEIQLMLFGRPSQRHNASSFHTSTFLCWVYSPLNNSLRSLPRTSPSLLDICIRVDPQNKMGPMGIFVYVYVYIHIYKIYIYTYTYHDPKV